MGHPHLEGCSKQKWTANAKSFKNPTRHTERCRACDFSRGNLNCYHSQQCVEKLLKGFLTLYGRKVPKTHKLIMLHKSCRELDEEFSLILEQCVQLNGYATDIRYPYFEALTVQDGLTAIQQAKKVVSFYNERLTKLNIKEILIDSK